MKNSINSFVFKVMVIVFCTLKGVIGMVLFMLSPIEHAITKRNCVIVNYIVRFFDSVFERISKYYEKN